MRPGSRGRRDAAGARACGAIEVAGAALAAIFCLAAVSAAPGLAAERGWAATVTTGSLGPKRAQTSKPRLSVEHIEHLITASTPPVEAEPAKGADAGGKARGEAPSPVAVAAPVSGPARQYCINIADAAADARVARQKRQLDDIGRELQERIAALEEKTAEYKRWLARRDEFSQRAQEQLVGIYARMRPDAAAPQLAAADEETAAAVLSKLDVKVSSAILSEMEPAQAARLATIIAGSAKVGPARSAGAQPDGKRS